MRFTTLLCSLAVLSLASTTFGLSVSRNNIPATKAATKNFYLLAAPEKSVTSPNAVGLDLVDPFYTPDYFLRVQEDAAAYLQFNLTSGELVAVSGLPHTGQPAVFKSNVDETGQVVFHQEQGTKGLFEFQGKFLAYKKDADGFTACDGELGNTIVVYNGTDASCERVYIFQSLTSPPSA